MSRYQRLFERLRGASEGAFVPFLVLGDPDVATSRRLLEALVANGADALELGIPFSDPIADGPTIQTAVVRAMEQGVRPKDCWALVEEVRRSHPDLPIGLLVYANLVMTRGLEPFYQAAATAGVDSILVADVPVMEAEPFVTASRQAGIDAVLMAPPNASDETLKRVARLTAGYTYVLSRSGVTGADRHVTVPHQAMLEKLKTLGAPPCLLGFGISTPDHVREALRCGADGAISGSAVVERVTANLGHPDDMVAAVGEFVASMKAATRAA